jgi:hypothetical protein
MIRKPGGCASLDSRRIPGTERKRVLSINILAVFVRVGVVQTRGKV